MTKRENFLFWINLFRIIPAFIIFKNNKYKEKCYKDLNAWKKAECKEELSDFKALGYFLTSRLELRNVFLNRLHENTIEWIIIRLLFPPLQSLYIFMPPSKIGGGLYIQHGFSTIIGAQEIGEYCHVNQQVTIGYNGDYCPIIKDRVLVAAGAIVIGNVTLNNDCVIGAGSVVTKNVPENSIVGGVPAKVIKKK